MSQATPQGHSSRRGSGTIRRAVATCSCRISRRDSAGSRGRSSLSSMQRTLPHKVKELCAIKLISISIVVVAEVVLRAAESRELGAVLRFWLTAAENAARPADTTAAVAAL